MKYAAIVVIWTSMPQCACKPTNYDLYISIVNSVVWRRCRRWRDCAWRFTHGSEHESLGGVATPSPDRELSVHAIARSDCRVQFRVGRIDLGPRAFVEADGGSRVFKLILSAIWVLARDCRRRCRRWPAAKARPQFAVHSDTGVIKCSHVISVL